VVRVHGVGGRSMEGLDGRKEDTGWMKMVKICLFYVIFIFIC